MADLDDDGQQAEYEFGSGILQVFRRQLKRLRELAGMERPEIGAKTGYFPATIASFEQGRRVRRSGSLTRRMRFWGRTASSWR